MMRMWKYPANSLYDKGVQPKGGVITSFFIACYWLTASVFAQQLPNVEIVYQEAIRQGIYNDPTWIALLHLSRQQPRITDPTFLFSHGNFSRQNELYLTLKQFLSNRPIDDDHAICRLPARFAYLATKLPAYLGSISTSACHKLNEYREKVPVKDISLIFVSENVSIPSSMMGHTLIKLSGEIQTEDKPRPVSYAVSFFTKIETANLPKLVYKSLVSGMQGFFSLVPYHQYTQQYHLQENRNLWEYPLELTLAQVKLIHLHLWELKEIDIQYLFAGYNCATIIHHILSVGRPELLARTRKWYTPKEVIKAAQEYHLIETSLLAPSLRWKALMLQDKIGRDQFYTTISRLAAGEKLPNTPATRQGFLLYELTDTYNRLLWKHQQIPEATYRNNQTQIDALATRRQDYHIDISGYKNPLKTVGESQLGLQWNHLTGSGTDWLEIIFLPASHRLRDDNRQYFGESELLLGELVLALAPRQKRLQLHRFTLYSSTSLVPWLPYIGEWSKSFAITLKKRDDIDSFNSDLIGNIDNKLGINYQLGMGMNIYSLLGLGVDVDIEKINLYADAKVGAYVYEIGNMKSTLFFTTRISDSSRFITNRLIAEHSILLGKTLQISMHYYHDLDDHRQCLGLGFTTYW